MILRIVKLLLATIGFVLAVAALAVIMAASLSVLLVGLAAVYSL